MGAWAAARGHTHLPRTCRTCGGAGGDGDGATPYRKVKEILGLKWLEGRRHRHIARALTVSVGKMSAVGRRAAAVGLEWERVPALSEAELEAAIYGAVGRPPKTPLPDPAWMGAAAGGRS